ncbi:hypothetical protein [Paracraurococcus lichenis]|uniref:Cell envelope biogenesis protein TolA n=1 Tax=Paracraurococcus lichenis TaxID=3064888 RepID=A0ABT9DV89_9PROT|nr:hypothetical protein [Paracraurococcus sp. LOR1-02]MDO9707793.1 hypothetical protein [Paracraurococcus sp. LOR1-02]
MRFWGLVSAGLHVALLVLGLLFGLPKRLEEPEEAIAVEIVAAPQVAQGERPAPVVGPPSVKEPPRPEPPAPERVTESIPSPPPPPPPPPPAAAPPPSPQVATPRLTPPPPEPTPVPPRPPQVAEAKPRPEPPPEPAPTPLPLPPPPPPAPAPPAPRQPPQPPQQQAQAKPEPPAPPPAPPRPDPVPQKTPAPPAPEPAKEAGTGRTPPVQKPQADSRSVLNTLERLQASRPSNEAPRGRPSPATGSPQQGGGAPTGTAALNAGEKAGLADKISECWSVDGGGLGIRDVVVELRVDVDAGGTVRNVRPNGSPPADPRARSVYEAARRALLDPKCNPLPLPKERLAALRDTVFRFNPRDLGLR